MAKSTINLRDSWTLLDGLPLRYRESTETYPAGTSTLVHLHGFGISGRYLLPTADILARHYQTYVPDLPGFGESEKPTTSLNITDLADATVRFMDDRGIEKASFVGNSMGCITASELSRKHPDRIDRAILCSPAGGPYNQPLLKGGLQLLRDGFHEPIRLWPIALTDYVRFGILPTFHLFRDMIAYPSLEQIRHMAIPTMVVVAANDPLESEENIMFNTSDNDFVSVVRLEGAAHASNFSHPQELANLIHQFLSGEPIADNPSLAGKPVVLKAGAGMVAGPNIASSPSD